MTDPKTSLVAVTALVVAGMMPPASAQDDSADPKKPKFTIDGAFTWMGTWGNDIPVAETISIDEQFDSGTVVLDESIERLFAEMRSEGVPWVQLGLEHGKWGVSAEFWTLDTDGSTQKGSGALVP